MRLTDYIQVSPKSDVPLVAQLVDQLTWLIAVGMLEAGDTLPSIRALAEPLSIHMHTVREAYHRLEAAGLVDVRRRRGTVVLPFDPIQIAKDYAPTPSFLFGVLLPSPRGVYQGFLQGVYEAAAEHGWMPLIAFTGDQVQLADRSFHQLLAKEVEGFIVASNPVITGLLALEAISDTTPVVHVDAPHQDANCILVDSERAAFLSTEHLLQHGHRRVAMITPPLDWEPVEPCYQGYQAALRSAGVEPEPDWVVQVHDFARDSGQQGILDLIDRPSPPKAAFFASDSLALGGLAGLRELGISAPHQFALTSYNNLDVAALVTPSLTTTTFPALEMGSRAVDMLFDLSNGELKEGGKITLDTELVIRQSCGCSP